MRAEPLDAETIVSATEELLRRHGPDKTTVLDVARLLGVSHGSVYRHFPSKAALREAVILRWLDRMRDGLTAAVRDTGPAPDRLRRLLTAMFAAKWAKAREDPELFATFRVLAAEHSGVASAHVAFLLAEVRAIVADGIARGDFAAGEPEVIARAVLNATSRFHNPLHAAEWHSPETAAESEDVISLILNGIRAR
ncbi:TetR family transcriptional regulator [Actinomadura madurae]|uniref:TetR family transcriptional regulator n=1 Tax=Actinomadura madurae TaxID=1993 RepID=UPI0020272D20|nr:TetR family transcriptional regulator [Actinomadura madurae]MCP9952591.1 TetR family transcriptional regulator [Actinomadura madurae]MCP9969354.1 TetR family transcriptional regulator [Actinomadura madurae]MCQ0006659.1 TetR family transcriptional regulator [Actinomadura madurae]MCQ0018041.1 TetR family transcriptional regulator [Actinomadura madurae]URN08794.1 TetR family transcriptional regulator [Actinomadura madurae]